MKLPKVILFIFILTLVCGLNVSGQCLADRHTTNLTDGWLSCDTELNPVPGLGSGHWIAYDLGQSYSIYDIHIWNLSHPGFLKKGVRDILIHHSIDGVNYQLVDTFTVPRAEASGFYEGHHLTDLGGLATRYIVVSALNTHGGSCAGFSEIRMHTTDIILNEVGFDFSPCENSGRHYNLTAGLPGAEQYSGIGVFDNGDGSFDFDPDLTGPGASNIYFDYLDNGQVTSMTKKITVLPCGDIRCPDCVLCNNGQLTVLDSSFIPSGIYHKKTLASSGRVHLPEDVRVRGQQEVNLLPGFTVDMSGEFLAEIRACDINLVSNSGYEDGLDDWSLWYSADSAHATYAVSSTEFYEGSQAMHVEVTQSHPSSWRVQLSQGGLMIEEGKTYRVSFSAKSDNAEGFNLRMELNGDPWTTYFSHFVRLQPHWENYAFEFTVEEPINFDARWSAHMAAYAGDYYIDKVRVSEK